MVLTTMPCPHKGHLKWSAYQIQSIIFLGDVSVRSIIRLAMTLKRFRKLDKTYFSVKDTDLNLLIIIMTYC
jgi:hypothetical protein